ncbi:RHS repeat protein [Anoxybacillus flavithermus]
MFYGYNVSCNQLHTSSSSYWSAFIERFSPRLYYIIHKRNYYHLNGHGDVVALTDASGNVVAQYEYDAWGNILSKTGALACKYSLLYRQHAIHLLVYQYSHHGQEKQKIFSSLYDVAE